MKKDITVSQVLQLPNLLYEPLC